jgi:hydroxymethylpyrimidine pyrophosphatase-like HAD family hydrolase
MASTSAELERWADRAFEAVRVLIDGVDRLRGHRRAPSCRQVQDVPLRLFSAQHGTSLALRDEVRDLAAHPAHYAHFSLTFFPELRDLPRQSLDVQPLCDGKAEAFRVLAARFGIARERVVAVGDADNDLEMLRGAGLGVAMGNGT